MNLSRKLEVLKDLTDQTPVKKKAKKTIRDFGIRQGESIACVVTLEKTKSNRFPQESPASHRQQNFQLVF